MSIYGIGVDQVDLKRVKRLLNKSEDKFLKRCFTEQEIKYAKRFSDPSKRLEISWKEIEVTGGGKPTINTFGRASATVKEKNITNIHISLSHENENAIAFAISEKDN